MKITRNNYEVYFIDYFEGNLNREEKEELQHFLSQNPDLKDEFDQFEEINVAQPEKEYKFKNELKKQVSDLGEINKDTIDEYSIAFLEGDLSEKEKEELLAAIDQDKNFKKTFDIYQQTKQEPDLDLIYAQKKQLKQVVLERKVVIRWVGYATVAAALVIGFFVIKPELSNDPQNTQVAKIEANGPVIETETKVDSTNDKTRDEPGNVGRPIEEKQKTIEETHIAIVKKGQTKNQEEVQKEDTKQIEKTAGPVTIDEFFEIAEKLEPIQVQEEELENEITIDQPEIKDILPDINNDMAKNETPQHETEAELQNDLTVPVEIKSNEDMAQQPAEKQENQTEKEKRGLKIDLWALAELGVKGFNKLNETNYSLRPHYSEDGEVESVTLVTDKRSITAPTI